MFEIVPNVFLSSFADVNIDKSFVVVNCSKDLPMKGVGVRVAVDDNPDENPQMYGAFEKVIQWIDDRRSEGRNVVVHCFAGQQRSAAVIAAYLMAKEHTLSVEEAINFIKYKKPDAFWHHVTFMPALIRWKSNF